MGKTYKHQLAARNQDKKFDRFSFAQSIGRAQTGGSEGTPKGDKGYKRRLKNEREIQEVYT